MIDKIIHFVWLGGNPLPEKYQEYIETWKKLLPDYEIKEWNEKTFNINSNEWVKKAIEDKNYSLAADVIRSWALLNYGGIYLDTDVELLKSLDDLVNKYDFFIGYETNCWVGCAVLGSKKGHPMMKEVYSRYEQPCPPLNAKSNMRCVMNFSACLERLYHVKLDGKMVNLPDNAVIVPRDYFFPKHYITRETKVTENSYCIHHYGATWHSKGKAVGVKIASSMVHLFGDHMFGILFERIARWNMLGQLKREYKKRVVIEEKENGKRL